VQNFLFVIELGEENSINSLMFLFLPNVQVDSGLAKLELILESPTWRAFYVP